MRLLCSVEDNVAMAMVLRCSSWRRQKDGSKRKTKVTRCGGSWFVKAAGRWVLQLLACGPPPHRSRTLKAWRHGSPATGPSGVGQSVVCALPTESVTSLGLRHSGPVPDTSFRCAQSSCSRQTFRLFFTEVTPVRRLHCYRRPDASLQFQWHDRRCFIPHTARCFPSVAQCRRPAVRHARTLGGMSSKTPPIEGQPTPPPPCSATLRPTLCTLATGPFRIGGSAKKKKNQHFLTADNNRSQRPPCSLTLSGPESSHWPTQKSLKSLAPE